MRDLYSKTNAPYLIAGAFATLVLLASGTLAVAPYVAFLSPIAAFNVALPVALSLSILSTLILALSYEIISNNKKLEVERNKFAQKEQELENKITLGKEAEEAANKEVEKLKNQSRELTREKQNLDKRAKKLDQKVNESEVERESLLEEKKSLEKRLEAKANHIFEITDELKKITKEKDEFGKQEEELLYEITRLCEHLQEKEGNLAEKEKHITELKRKIDNNKHAELKNEELHKEIEKLSKEKEKLDKEINKLCKKKEELHKRQEELCVELDELQYRFKEINQKNENLSQELKRKFEELYKADDLIKNQSFELNGIRKDCNNEVKSLKNLLLKQDAQIEQLEEGLLRNAEEKKGYLLEMLESVIDKVEKLVNANEAIGDHSRKIILQETQKIKFILKEIMQFMPGEDSRCESPSEETFDFLLEDSGYNSRSSTQIKLPNSLLTESYERSQSEGICKT